MILLADFLSSKINCIQDLYCQYFFIKLQLFVNQQIQMKCQHGQIISKFCIADNCNCKTAGACQYCLKKNHFHLGHLETLTLKEVEDLALILSISHKKKQKQSTLKELLINYFQALKSQISKSLQSVCRNMIDRVSHSYLYNANVLQSYKKVNGRDFSKISANQLRQLHLFNLKNTTINLQNQEEKFYLHQVLNIQQTIEPIKKLFDAYQIQIQSYDSHFSTDSFFYKKIIELTQKIIISHSQNQIRQKKLKNKIIQLAKNNPQSEPIHQAQQINKLQANSKLQQNNKLQQFKKLLAQQSQQPKLLSLEQYRNQKSKSTQNLRSKSNINLQLLNVSKNSKQRKISIVIDADKFEVLKRKKSDGSENSTTPENQNTEFYPQSIQIKQTKIGKILKNDKSISKLNLKNHNYKIEDDENEEFSIRIQEPSIKFNQLNSLQTSKTSTFQNSNLLTSQSFHWKQCNSVVLDEPNSQIQEHKVILENKKIKFPPSIDHDYMKSFNNHQDIKKKVIRYQIHGFDKQHTEETQSPLFRKKYQDKKAHENLVQLHKISSHDEKPGMLRKNSSYDESTLNQDQLKSLALLLESIKLPSDKAIRYLRKSFQYCPENLSTAEYLSFLLIEENHPKQCLELCNLMISKILNHTQNFSFSVHILCNKAAALNALGRFSQTIQFLEKILQHVQKDTLYKNLADAYCALGITEKSILNYQKCISLNQEFDQAFYNLAVCLYSQHHYQQALDIVSEAIKLNSQRDEYIQLYRNTKTKVL